ncbi:MAG: ATP-binding cassette domain-containing protein [Nostoc sp.]|uniref:ATP-binding cassette domain-containing protein n=1 Tax=Nostoc sp. TaxID=1180 RepID=UPI002FFC0495
MSNHPVITLNQISKVYTNGTVALQDLNLAIPESQFVSLVGPSGCGKSTVLRVIAGLGHTSSGSIDCLSALSDLILSKWHESAVKQEN